MPKRVDLFDLEKATKDLVAGLNGLTFCDADGNDDYVRKITPLIRSALRTANEQGMRDLVKAMYPRLRRT